MNTRTTYAVPACRAILMLTWMLIFLAGVTLPVEAACNRLRLRDLTVVNWSGGNGSGYGVFDATRYIEQIPFRVTKAGGDCDYVVALSSDGASGQFRQLTRSTDSIDFNIYTTASASTPVGSIPGADQQEVLSGTFATAGSQEDIVNFYIALEPGQIVPRGRYSSTMAVILYEGTLASAIEVQRINLTVRANVDEVVEISLVDSGQPFDLFDTGYIVDFGQSLGPATQGFDMRIRGNAGFDVRFKSGNRGAMQFLADTRQPGIPYSFSVNNSPAAFDSAGQVKVALKPSGTVTPVGGDAFPVEFSIGDIGNFLAGIYEDTVTITVIAK